MCIPRKTLFPEMSPNEPVWRTGLEPPPPPCDLGPMVWFQRLIAPAKPFPLEIPVTSTNSPDLKMLTLTSSPI